MERKPLPKCPSCSAEMKSYGGQQVQVVLLGTIPVERTLPLEVLVCPKCDRMAFYALDETRKILKSRNFQPEVRLCYVCKHEAVGYEKCPYCGAPPKDDRTPMF